MENFMYIVYSPSKNMTIAIKYGHVEALRIKNECRGAYPDARIKKVPLAKQK